MPKLFQIALESNKGSVGRIAEQIGETVMENGWKSYVTFARESSPSTSEVIKIGTKLDVYRHGIETRIFDNHCFSSKSATRDLIKTIKKIKPDVIHMHHLHGYYLNIEILFEYLKESGLPLVWTFHDCWSFTGHCAHFDFVGCDKWKTQCYSCEQKGEYPKSLFFDRSRQNYIDKKRIFNSVENLTIVSVSKWLDGKVKESFLKNIDSRVIYNGVDLNCFYPKDSRVLFDNKYKTKGKYLMIGVATTWDSKKGFSDFISLSKELNESFIIILIGLNKKQLKNLPSNVIGIERTESQDELCEFYSASDLFLNLSVEETFGLTTVEALACGLPVIVYNATASPELVSDDTGYVVEKGNIKELIETILKVKTLGKQHFTLASRDRAISLFDKNERFLEYFNLYNEILNKNVE